MDRLFRCFVRNADRAKGSGIFGRVVAQGEFRFGDVRRPAGERDGRWARQAVLRTLISALSPLIVTSSSRPAPSTSSIVLPPTERMPSGRVSGRDVSSLMIAPAEPSALTGIRSSVPWPTELT